jgi:hypothetical protein
MLIASSRSEEMPSLLEFLTRVFERYESNGVTRGCGRLSNLMEANRHMDVRQTPSQLEFTNKAVGK